MQTFPSLGLSANFGPELNELGIVTPTPIQAEAIPLLLEGNDLIGIAQTGTGKTLAFGLPIIQRIQGSDGRALIMAPTRELAVQIADSLKVFCRSHRLKTAVLVGGMGMQGQCADLRRRPDIVIATPGRLLDHVMRGNLRLREFNHVVLDEADRMLDMGFLPAIERILEGTPTERQTMMFSATMPHSIEMLISKYLRDPKKVEITPAGTSVELIEQAAYIVHQIDKGDLLDELIRSVTGPVLVFARTRHGARKVAANLNSRGHHAAEIHSDRSQSQRNSAMDGFRTGRHRVLVATDIAARGIDVKDIALVVQFDLPDCDEDYIHRIGRTGRAGAEGRAVVMVSPEAVRRLDLLERTIGQDIPTAENSPLPRAQSRHRNRPQPRPNVRPHAPRPAMNRSDVPAREYQRPDARPMDDRRPAPQHFEGRRNDERPAYDRNRDQRPYEPRTSEPRRDDAPRPANNRDDRPSEPRRYDSQRNDSRPAYNRDDRPSEPRRYDSQRNDARPAYNRNDRPSEPRRYDSQRTDSRPAYNRDRNERPYNRNNSDQARPEPRRYDDRPAYKPDETRQPEGDAARPFKEKKPRHVARNPQWPHEQAPAPKAPRPSPASPANAGAAPVKGRPRPNTFPNAYKGKVAKKKGAKGQPSGGFVPPKKRKR